ncbi:TIGR03862 family flavoprotein [Limnohabitans sp. 2KL-27]|uniref:NAD(P)/FAD-dependent oxidoreductase n=1 Tax=Limnohabitans sp. 2KL-27 TaxID=1100705 RepID=UPI000AB0B75B|nr:TIGR03862 family flavoprotein [Limnohabitans sp. 2KL-27]
MTYFPESAVSSSGSALEVDVAIVGGGPAGLMAAQVLSQAGVSVHLFDAMPSVGRKFLLAGKGGLNLTHAEPMPQFRSRYGAHQAQVGRWLDQMDAQSVRAWAKGLGVETFVGSSGRVFPLEMKAAPLLRAWLHRLRHPAFGVPVQFHMRHRWQGWDGESLVFQPTGSSGVSRVHARATLLALGGASWPRLGSDGAWVPLLADQGVVVEPLQPANCGFDVLGREGLGWTDHFRSRYAGHPLKSVVLRVDATSVQGHGAHSPPRFERQGEFVITDTGVEGSLIYAASALLRDDLAQGAARLTLDLLPDKCLDQVHAEVRWPRGSRSLSSHLKSRLGIDGVKMGLLFELCSPACLAQPEALARSLKSLSVPLKSPRPVAEAISTAGGVAWPGMTSGGMLTGRPGVYCAGEMLDWEAPTGGYLLTACLASGWSAGQAILTNL